MVIVSKPHKQKVYDSISDPKEKVIYLKITDKLELEQYEYFHGFTQNTAETVKPTNKEVELYRDTTDSIKLKTIATLLNFIPHAGQQPIFFDMDERREVYNNFVLVLGRRTGKSIMTSVVAARELLVPFSSTVLLAPSFNNARVLFDATLKHVNELKLPIKAINKGAFRFELENGARFSANSEANIESILGSFNSLILVDEVGSFNNLEHIMNQMLVPTLLDYGARASGVLYGRQIYLGTPRGEENYLFDLYIKSEEFSNWASYNAPSTVNPILPETYFKQMKLELGDMLYRQEILAEFIGTGDNVFYAFSATLNTYKTGDVNFSYCPVIAGIDVGFRDSTAAIWIYRDARGYYYIDKAYSKNQTSTAEHIKSFTDIEASLLTTPEMRYLDPSAAQAGLDWVTDYGYTTLGANNAIQPGIAYINQLLTPTGANKKPRLYINEDLGELLRQIRRVRWKEAGNKKSQDPFIKDSKGTHWDLIAALRYALYSDMYSQNAGFVFSSKKD